ncbi:MAG: hypothetical protein A2494_02400 [Candidatus Lloydbacteria bacterium RIFOXYC12_FULL_46_25]|uniref:Uncharacterized protein n=1 Tax=Candidatus Lloydbacteria bacterium RIFOXYC12_FULL_46_25 TaxID=1798670 RepID=A0A1G2DT28_9BACT|nr:MAG: hypothetical protein A2494_02400 [Candidatus Lloydbacteria bacterium RIFOXYC12_FULL_46_25]
MGHIASRSLLLLTLLFTLVATSLEIRANNSSVKAAPEGMTPAQSMSEEFALAKEALSRGDYGGVTAHADNMRFIATYTKESLPADLEPLERVSQYMQVGGIIDEADNAYRKGSYNEAILIFNRAIALMKTLGIKPPKKALLLAQRINSGIFQPLYITDGIPSPALIRI